MKKRNQTIPIKEYVLLLFQILVIVLAVVLRVLTEQCGWRMKSDFSLVILQIMATIATLTIALVALMANTVTEGANMVCTQR
jgi:hypothetical protein